MRLSTQRAKGSTPQSLILKITHKASWYAIQLNGLSKTELNFPVNFQKENPIGIVIILQFLYRYMAYYPAIIQLVAFATSKKPGQWKLRKKLFGVQLFQGRGCLSFFCLELQREKEKLSTQQAEFRSYNYYSPIKMFCPRQIKLTYITGLTL